MNKTPSVKPIDEIHYEHAQSKYDVAPKVPFRALITGPSGSGKSNLLINFILDIYRGVFERIYIWSPSINVDTIWLPVKKYIKETMKVDTDKEQFFFEEFNPEDMERVIDDTQHKITEYSKKKKIKKLFKYIMYLR